VTEALAKYQLRYNTRYFVVICNRCSEGVPKSRLHGHLSDKSRERGSVMLNGATLYHGLSPPKDLPLILEMELSAFLGGKITIRDTKGWKDVAIPLPGQIGPIQGLAEVEACICAAC
jgi:hypothetical protein